MRQTSMQRYRRGHLMKTTGNVWFPTVIGLHILTLVAVLFIALTSCGTAASPSDYVWTSRSELISLSWDKQHGQLSGMSTSISYASTAFAFSTMPDIFTASYHGTQDGPTVHLTLQTLAHAELSGTQSGDAQTLTLNVPDPTTGQLRSTTWIAVIPVQEIALVAAFKANEVIHGMLPIVEQDASAEPTPWTDQNRGYIVQVQSEVQADQQMLTTIQQAHDETVQCQDVQTFQSTNMLVPAAFVYAYALVDAALMRHLATLAQAWKQVQQHPIPPIAGLSASQLSWVVPPAQYQAGTHTAMQEAAHITSSERADTRQLHALLRQYQSIMQTEQAIARSCLGA
jgi:hypothetical protein